MAFRIRFAGVCLFDLEDPAGCRVLLPEARGGLNDETGGARPHFGYAFFPKEVVDPEAADRFDALPPDENGSEWLYVRLDEASPISIFVESANGAPTNVDELKDPNSGLPNLKETNPDKHLNTSAHSCAGIVSMSGGKFVGHQTNGGLEGGSWTMNGSTRDTMIHEVTWETDERVSAIKVSSKGRVRLTSQDFEARVYCIEACDAKDVFETPRERIGQADVLADDDFKLLYRLLSDPPASPDVPTWIRSGSTPRTIETPLGVPKGASLPTCFPGGWW